LKAAQSGSSRFARHADQRRTAVLLEMPARPDAIPSSQNGQKYFRWASQWCDMTSTETSLCDSTRHSKHPRFLGVAKSFGYCRAPLSQCDDLASALFSRRCLYRQIDQTSMQGPAATAPLLRACACGYGGGAMTQHIRRVSGSAESNHDPFTELEAAIGRLKAKRQHGYA
jgi:hypothetical protein